MCALELYAGQMRIPRVIVRKHAEERERCVCPVVDQPTATCPLYTKTLL